MEFKIAQFVFDILKLAPRYLISISIMAAIILFTPESFLKKIGLFQLAQDYHPWIGGTFVITTVLWLVDRSRPVVEWIRNVRLASMVRNKQLKKLQSLTEDEKKILRFYITRKTKTNYLTFSDGIVNGLESAGVITRTFSHSVKNDRFSYNISDFAWNHLQEHQSILVGDTKDIRTDIKDGEYW